MLPSLRTSTAAALTLSTIDEASFARLPLFRNANGGLAHSRPDGSDWTPADWMQALVGELGEYANVRKKYQRGDLTAEQFAKEAAKELADVQLYLVLLARRALDVPGRAHPRGVDLSQAVVDKFNEVSRRFDCPLRLTPQGWHNGGDDCTPEAGSAPYSRVTYLSHLPAPGRPRKGHLDEAVFAQVWFEANNPSWLEDARHGLTDHSTPMQAIERELPFFVTQEHATLAATLITWLGTNCGRAMLEQAERFALPTSGMTPRDAYVAAFAVENVRSRGVNSGLTLLDFLVSACQGAERPAYGYVTAEHQEVAEQVMAWLGWRGRASIVACAKNKVKEIHALHPGSWKNSADTSVANTADMLRSVGLGTDVVAAPTGVVTEG